MQMIKFKKKHCLLFATLFIFEFGYASTSSLIKYPFLSDTKVKLSIEGDKKIKQGVLNITNPDERAWLVQSWIEDEEGEKSSNVYPSIARIEAHSNLVLRIYPPLSDKCNAGWVVVLFIPPDRGNKSNQLAIPVAYRLKMKE